MWDAGNPNLAIGTLGGYGLLVVHKLKLLWKEEKRTEARALVRLHLKPFLDQAPTPMCSFRGRVSKPSRLHRRRVFEWTAWRP